MQRPTAFYRRLCFGLLVLMTLFVPTPATQAASPERCFSETNQCISGRFRQYWEQNGGLAVFGFPIGPAQGEVNRDSGQTYLTQWFERNRFELHPENQFPYDVLLGRLGDDLLRQRGTDWQQLPGEDGPKAGCLYFQKTDHNVCNQENNQSGFKYYWLSHGLEFDGAPGVSFEESLALFGLPLTDEHVETNSSGDTVITQWFERARFEWHPDKPQEYKVLLGLLGNEARPASATSRILAQNVKLGPAAGGDYLFWIETDPTNGANVLRAYNAADGTTFVVANQHVLDVQPATDGVSVVWAESMQAIGTARLLRMDLATRQTQTIVSPYNASDSTQSQLALDGDWLYYTDTTSQHTGLFARSISQNNEILISANGQHPSASNGRLIWSTTTTSGNAPNYQTTCTLFLRLTPTERDITLVSVNSNQLNCAQHSISGNYIVWAYTAPDVDNRVFLYTISSATTTAISQDAAVYPHVLGSTVAWATNQFFDSKDGLDWSLETYDIASQRTTTLFTRITYRGGPVYAVKVVGNQVVLAYPNRSLELVNQ